MHSSCKITRLNSAFASQDHEDDLKTDSNPQEDKNSLIEQYLLRLMECHDAAPGAPPLDSISGSQSEFMKRQPIVLEQVSSLLAGSKNFKNFRETIDSADAKSRVDMVDVIARQFKYVGMLMRVMYCVEDLCKAPLDHSVCCQRFVEEVKLLVGAEHVRLWLVDSKNSLIWEWKAAQGKPVKRPFVVSTGAALTENVLRKHVFSLQLRTEEKMVSIFKSKADLALRHEQLTSKTARRMFTMQNTWLWIWLAHFVRCVVALRPLARVQSDF